MPVDTTEINDNEKKMVFFNNLIESLKLFPITHLDSVKSPKDIEDNTKKTAKFNEILEHINHLRRVDPKKEKYKPLSDNDIEPSSHFLRQAKTLTERLNTEITIYNKNGNLIISI